MDVFLSFGGALIIVIGAILLTSWAAKYLQTKNAVGAGRTFKIIDRIMVGKDSYVVLLAFQGEYYLLGVGSGSITLLEKVDGPLEAAEINLTGTFKSKLSALKKDHPSGGGSE